MNTNEPGGIGTLVAVVLKARNLPNKRHIGKQDPYCSVGFNGETQRTRAIKRGGQHPEWDEELRFTLYEEDSVMRNGGDDGTPPPLPPKESRAPKKIKGGKTMSVACFADDQREPELIGETTVDLTEVLTKGETDEWFTLTHKDKYCGEVYLELTFWSHEPRPEKKATAITTKNSRHYVGRGEFVPFEESLAAPGVNAGEHRRDDSPSTLPSNSSHNLALYMPSYEQTARARARSPRASSGSSSDQLVNDFGELGFQDSARRPDSFAHVQEGLLAQSSSSRYSIASSLSSSHSHQSSELLPPPSNGSYRATTPQSQRYHRNSVASSQPYSMPQYSTVNQHIPPAPSGFSYHTPPRHGPRYSVPTTSSGFVSNSEPSGLQLPSHISEPSGLVPSGYSPAPSRTPVPAAHSPLPQHSSSLPPYLPSNSSVSSLQHPLPAPPQHSQVPFLHQSSYIPPPPVSAPPMQYPPPQPSSTFPVPAPPQIYPTYDSPNAALRQEYISPASEPSPAAHVIPNYVPGSRPLPPQPQGVGHGPPLQISLVPQTYGQQFTSPLPTMYGQNSPATPTPNYGAPIGQQHNPLPTPPGPPGPLAPVSRTPPQQASNALVPASSFHHIPPPPPLPAQPSSPSNSPQSYINGSPQTNGANLSAVPPPPGHIRSVSGRPGLPLPPAPPSMPYQPHPAAPLPPSQSHNAYTFVPLSSFESAQTYHPGPPPRPPAQITGQPRWMPQQYAGYETAAGRAGN
ncbi:hypothetical protein FA95DRAFT_833939 [Auriscalpium vulgare]|uniref:Uncharacterized protein n=1 Tax=Auriscalpium vulgare TaxID=40419 RepID=A0ACB8S0M1_9AGAM|nr:hypothetical protein FA95DRAFT_833939 [Auriscalpium vulgare]